MEEVWLVEGRKKAIPPSNPDLFQNVTSIYGMPFEALHQGYPDEMTSPLRAYPDIRVENDFIWRQVVESIDQGRKECASPSDVSTCHGHLGGDVEHCNAEIMH